jgi:hypothetical protein
MEEKDLAIVIECEPNFCNNWMSFVSWYSIYKKMPEAQVFLSVPYMDVFFGWTSRVGVKIFRNQFKIERPVIKHIKPSVIAVREFSDNIDIVSSKTDIYASFVDYKYGCGSFILDKWQKIKRPPFEDAQKKFFIPDLTINEYAVLNTWEQCSLSYRQIVGGSI